MFDKTRWYRISKPCFKSFVGKRDIHILFLWKNISCRKIGIDIALHPVAFPDSSSPEHTVQYLVASASKSIYDREHARVNNRVLRKRWSCARCDERIRKQRSSSLSSEIDSACSSYPSLKLRVWWRNLRRSSIADLRDVETLITEFWKTDSPSFSLFSLYSRGMMPRFPELISVFWERPIGRYMFLAEQFRPWRLYHTILNE